MKEIEIYRVEYDPQYAHAHLRFAHLPSMQDILDVMTAMVEKGWNGRMMGLGFKDYHCPASMSEKMKAIRAGHYRVYRETLYQNEAC
jgi:hypothetical protein